MRGKKGKMRDEGGVVRKKKEKVCVDERGKEKERARKGA